MVNTISTAIENMGYSYIVLVDQPDIAVFRLIIALENTKADCIIDIRVPEKLVAVFVVCPIIIPEAGRKRIAEFLTIANYGLILGNFEMDMDDGELRFKSTFLFHDDEQDDEFKQHLFNALQSMDKYFPGIMAVLFAGLEPRTAIHQVNNIIDPKMN